MAYLDDCVKHFGILNFTVRWVELIFSVLVLVLGGVIPYEKIRNTSNVVLTNSGIYSTAGAVRYTIFTGAFGAATALLVIILFFIRALHREWVYWIILILDILNWIFFLCCWAALAAALSSTFNALRFCGSTSNIKNAYIASTPFPLPSVINYLNGLGIACRCVYAAIAFAVAVWLLWLWSIFLTGKMIAVASEASENVEERAIEGSAGERKSEGTEGKGSPSQHPHAQPTPGA